MSPVVDIIGKSIVFIHIHIDLMEINNRLSSPKLGVTLVTGEFLFANMTRNMHGKLGSPDFKKLRGTIPATINDQPLKVAKSTILKCSLYLQEMVDEARL